MAHGDVEQARILYGDGNAQPIFIWTNCLDMAHGDPLRAKEIYETLDETWWERWIVWHNEKHKAKIPDSIVGMYSKD